MSELLHLFGIHKLIGYYDIEYSQHGEYYFCYHCEKQFDKDKKEIKL